MILKLWLAGWLIVFAFLESHHTPKHASWLNMCKSKSACCVANVWIAALASGRPSLRKSKPGSNNETLPVCTSNGSSPLRRRDQAGTCLSRHRQRIIIIVTTYQA